MAKKEMTYTEAFSKLQKIVNQVEEEKLDIDELGSKLKEASELLAICQSKLFMAKEEALKMLSNLK